MSHPEPSIATRCIHGGRRPGPGDSSVVTPIFQTTNFVPSAADYAQVEAGDLAGSRVYSRYGNPTVAAVERRIAALENAQEARLFASGNAASHAAIMALCLPGGHLIASDKLYGGTRELLQAALTAAGGRVSFVDFSQLSAIEGALEPQTRVLFCESLANPTLEVADLPALGEFSKAHNLRLVVDATYATPILQRPLDLGADLVMHSVSKYYGGHSDVLGGVLAGSAEIMEQITAWRTNTGGVLDPHAAFLLDRGIKTLAVRVRAHQAGAAQLAEFLAGHSAVERVLYPGLASFAQHDLAKRVLQGFGGMLLLCLRGSDEDGKGVLERLRVALPAPSLGGVETLVSQPAFTSHACLSAAERQAAGIPPGSIRISVGIEEPADLLADFDQALG
ncbi:MAG: cystathionine beta-lyase/cystathionine gamma-synthase [Candidatus Paceibacteria bacterium]|jgi:cystathionine beta-lyase/cystathionine gamma-synthase